MVLTPSTMLELGTPIPAFQLKDLQGREISPDRFAEKRALLVMFISRHCPFVQHILDELTELGRDFCDSDLGIVAICSNDADNYPDDSPEKLREMAVQHDLRFPICYDESQEVAMAFRAACTPDFFLFDEKGRLVYRGQLDDSRPGSDIPTDGSDLRAAIAAALAGEEVSNIQKPSIGCNIKWKPGNEPDYFRS